MYAIRSYYALHAKGFLNASVDLDVDTVMYKNYPLITEKYIINEGEQWKVHSVKYKTPSYSIYNELLTYSRKSFLKENGPYSETSLQLERNRLSKVLKNGGYFDFASNYIHYEVDTNNVHGEVDILILVDPPKTGERHTRYYINDITFETDPNDPALADTVEYEDVTYIQHAKKYKPKILDGKLALKESTPFNELLSNDTRRFLSQMDAFKFVNIEYVKTGKDSLNVITSYSIHYTKLYEASHFL